MLRSIICLFLCVFLAHPVAASPAEHALRNNWTGKKFRAAIRRTPNLFECDQHNENILHLAVRLNRYNHLEPLFDEAPSVNELLNKRNKSIQSPIELAISLGHIECFRFLLRQVGNPNYRVWNQYKWALLHLAAYYNQPQIARELILAGGDVNIMDRTNEQWTPLDVALHFGRSDVAQALRELGARVHALDLANEVPAILLPHVREELEGGQDAATLLQEGPSYDSEEEFAGFRMPLSDFIFGPAIVRTTVSAIILLIIWNQFVPNGSL